MILETAREAFELAKGPAFDLVCTPAEEKRLWRFWCQAWNAALDLAAYKVPVTGEAPNYYHLRAQED